MKSLIIHHTDDKVIATRHAHYGLEAALAFEEKIFVPGDLEVTDFSRRPRSAAYNLL